MHAGAHCSSFCAWLPQAPHQCHSTASACGFGIQTAQLRWQHGTVSPCGRVRFTCGHDLACSCTRTFQYAFDTSSYVRSCLACERETAHVLAPLKQLRPTASTKSTAAQCSHERPAAARVLGDRHPGLSPASSHLCSSWRGPQPAVRCVPDRAAVLQLGSAAQGGLPAAAPAVRDLYSGAWFCRRTVQGKLHGT